MTSSAHKHKTWLSKWYEPISWVAAVSLTPKISATYHSWLMSEQSNEMLCGVCSSIMHSFGCAVVSQEWNMLERMHNTLAAAVLTKVYCLCISYWCVFVFIFFALLRSYRAKNLPVFLRQPASARKVKVIAPLALQDFVWNANEPLCVGNWNFSAGCKLLPVPEVEQRVKWWTDLVIASDPVNENTSEKHPLLVSHFIHYRGKTPSSLYLKMDFKPVYSALSLLWSLATLFHFCYVKRKRKG